MICFKSTCLLFNKKIFPIISPAKYISQHVLYSRPSINWWGENFSPHTNSNPSYFNMAETFSVGMYNPPLLPLAVSFGLCVPSFCMCCLCQRQGDLFTSYHFPRGISLPKLSELWSQRQLKMQNLFLHAYTPGRSCDNDFQSLITLYVKWIYTCLEKTSLTLK